MVLRASDEPTVMLNCSGNVWMTSGITVCRTRLQENVGWLSLICSPVPSGAHRNGDRQGKQGTSSKQDRVESGGTLFMEEPPSPLNSDSYEPFLNVFLRVSIRLLRFT